MNTLDQILGRKPLEEDDVPPVMAARTRPATMVRRESPKDTESKKLRDKARQSSVVASIIGMAESDEEAIIPDDAKRIDPYASDQIPGLKQSPDLNNDAPASPALSNAHGEELIPPTAALVAPDVTPDVFKMVDPSQVPAPPKPTNFAPGAPTVTPGPPGDGGALDTIMGRNTQPAPAMPNGMPPITAESFMQSMNPLEIKAKAAGSLIPASAGGSSMPEHKQGDGRTIFNVVRSLVG